jgi:hypothetical protein
MLRMEGSSGLLVVHAQILFDLRMRLRRSVSIIDNVCTLHERLLNLRFTARSRLSCLDEPAPLVLISVVSSIDFESIIVG